MEEIVKYLTWLGVFLAFLGFFAGDVLAYIALAEFVIGVVIGAVAIQQGVKDIESRAVMFSIISFAMGLLPQPAYVAGVMQWMQMWFALMAMMYVPATFVNYVGKVVRGGA